MRHAILAAAVLACGCHNLFPHRPATSDAAGSLLDGAWRDGSAVEAGSSPDGGLSELGQPADATPPGEVGVTSEAGVTGEAGVTPPDLCVGVCTPGQKLTCGNCGTKLCAASCTWGPCTGEGVCAAGLKQSCGNCGTKTCNASCAWSTCSGTGVCAAGSKQPCPNGCGDKTCSTSCSWGTCSSTGSLVSTTYKCWSSNHCAPGKGKCVDCWMKCNSDGTLSPDGWCSSCTTCAGKLDQC